MTAIIDGRAVAQRLRSDIADEVPAFVAEHGRPPGLATVLVGDDPASAIYVAAKQKACAEVGIAAFAHHLSGQATQDQIVDLLDQLNADPAVSGILCQLPLPAHLDGSALTNRIDPGKDVDGLTTANAGRLALGMSGLRPCTPAGVMRLLEASGVELCGATAVVIGRSNLFGKPMVQMLLAADTTVTICHSHTRDLASHCRRADVVIAAAGRARLVRRNWIKPEAVVIDVGINRTPDGLVGDVDFDAVNGVAGAITPVPGGVGPMTIACLLRNTLDAAAAVVEPIGERAA